MQQITTSAGTMRPGEKFTIEGCGLSARGKPIVGGRFVHNGRKARCKTLTVFVVGQVVGGTAAIAEEITPAIWAESRRNAPPIGKGPRNRWGAKR